MYTHIYENSFNTSMDLTSASAPVPASLAAQYSSSGNVPVHIDLKQCSFSWETALTPYTYIEFLPPAHTHTHTNKNTHIHT